MSLPDKSDLKMLTCTAACGLARACIEMSAEASFGATTYSYFATSRTVSAPACTHEASRTNKPHMVVPKAASKPHNLFRRPSAWIVRTCSLLMQRTRR